jgi:branched-chain amino acid transport system ATP-binding protein
VLLEVKNLDAGYGFIQILRDISINVDQGEYVCIIGPNGAGKSTTLKAIAGLIQPMAGSIYLHGISLDGKQGKTNVCIDDLPGNKVCSMGVSLISEDGNLFTQLSVMENLDLGAYTIKDKKTIQKTKEFVFELFPVLKARSKQLAGTMSGGERKMLALARGIMSNPSILLVDEPSLGLAPQLINEVFRSLDVLKENGATILLVEQNVTKTLKVTDRGYVLEHGKVVIEGKSSDLIENEHVRTVYLGV